MFFKNFILSIFYLFLMSISAGFIYLGLTTPVLCALAAGSLALWYLMDELRELRIEGSGD